MTDNKLSELKDTARKILSYNRMQLLNKHPFIGNVAMNLDLIPIRDARCDSAMTDGNTIFFDIDFMSRLTNDEIQFVLGHEIWHVIMIHFLRQENREHGTFNIACDMEVNQILDADGFLAPADALFPNKKHSRTCSYNFDDGLSAEEYYDLLIKMREKEEERNNFGSQEKNESGSDDKLNGFNGGNDRSENKTVEPNNDQKKSKKNKKNTKKCEGQFDKHFDKSEDQDKALKNAMEEGAEDKYGEKGADEDYNPKTFTNETESREATERIREMVIGAAQTYERSRGELPEYIKKHVNKLLESKLPWKELLSAFITSGFQSKTNWSVPNRRFAYRGTYLPSHDGDMMRIAIGIDTSGSCGEECGKFLSEISGITKSFDSYELHVIQCDTEIKNYTMYDENNPLDPESNIEFQGFGGTRLHPIFEYMDLNDIDVDAAVIFTDGCCEDFEEYENFNIPIMWIITGNHNCKNLKIGEKIYMKD